MKVEVAKNQKVLASECEVADRFGSRLVGLLSRSSLAEGAGMWFPDCKSVHTWMMRFPIDVVFLKGDRVSSVHSNVAPWRIFPLTDLRAESVLELPAGTAKQCELVAGDEIRMEVRSHV